MSDPVRVELSDGRIVEFPAGMSQGDMRAALRRLTGFRETNPDTTDDTRAAATRGALTGGTGQARQVTDTTLDARAAATQAAMQGGTGQPRYSIDTTDQDRAAATRAALPALSNTGGIIPPRPMPQNPQLVTTGPGAGGGMQALYDQGILPRRYMGDPAPQRVQPEAGPPRVNAATGATVDTTDDARAARGFGQSGYMSGLVQPGETAPVTMPEGTVGDVVAGGLSGVGRGVAGMLDLPGQVMDMNGNVIATLTERGYESVTGEPLGPEFRQLLQHAIDLGPWGSGDAARTAGNALTGGGLEYQPQTTAGEYAQTIGEFIPGALAAGGVNALIPYAVAPAVLSETAGQLTEGMTFPENAPLVGGQSVEPYARVAGALAGPSVFNAGMRVVTPNPADPARVAAANRLRAEGVTPTAGQVTGDRALRLREDYIPRTAQMFDDQADEFTAAVLRRVGIEGGRATPEALATRMDEIGQVFDDVAGRATIQPDPSVSQRVQAILANYAEDTAEGTMLPRIRNIAEDLLTRPANQPISGSQYNAWRSRLSRLTVGSDRQTGEAAVELIGVLDDMLAASVSRADVTALQQARGQWRDILAIARAATRGGEDAAAGIITPAGLRMALTSQSRDSYALARRELDRLARDGATIMSRPGNSNTPDRLIANLPMLQSGGGAFGAGSVANFLGADPLTTGAIATAAFAMPYARNALMGSRVGQNYLMNQALPYRANLLNYRAIGMAPGVLGQGENR